MWMRGLCRGWRGCGRVPPVRLRRRTGGRPRWGLRRWVAGRRRVIWMRALRGSPTGSGAAGLRLRDDGREAAWVARRPGICTLISRYGTEKRAKQHGFRGKALPCPVPNVGLRGRSRAIIEEVGRDRIRCGEHLDISNKRNREAVIPGLRGPASYKGDGPTSLFDAGDARRRS